MMYRWHRAVTGQEQTLQTTSFLVCYEYQTGHLGNDQLDFGD